jgi:hypothetical protein
MPHMSLFSQFQLKGGVSKIISVTLASLKLWKAQALADSWSLWLEELDSFSKIPLFFQLFLQQQQCKQLLFKVLAGQPDADFARDPASKATWETECKEAVQINYRILGDVFSVSGDTELREKALECNLLEKILKRLSVISGEKPRKFEEAEEEVQVVEEVMLTEKKVDKTEPKKHEKKVRKGVGYSSK